MIVQSALKMDSKDACTYTYSPKRGFWNNQDHLNWSLNEGGTTKRRYAIGASFVTSRLMSRTNNIAHHSQLTFELISH